MKDIENLFTPSFSAEDVTIHSRKRLFQGFFAIDGYELSYRTFSGGRTPLLSRELFTRDKNAVGVLAWDRKTDEVALIEQFRPGALKDEKSPWLIEMAGGLIDDGESEIEAALREVYEETGLEIKESDLYRISSVYSSPGGMSERVTIFVANTSLEHLPSHGGESCEDEDIRIFRVKSDEAYENVKNGNIRAAIAMIAIMALKLEKAEIERFFAAADEG